MTQSPVVVAILTHRDPPLVRRLTQRVLAGSGTVVVVHHDPRGPALDLPTSPRIHLVPEPQECAWGRYGLARAMLDTVAFAAERIPDLSWLLLISGQDYPAQSMQAIERELDRATANAYLRHFRIDGDPASDEHPWQQVTRRRYLHSLRLPGTHRSVPFPRRSPFGDDTGLYAGDMWVNLDASAVEHLIAQRERLPHVDRYLRRCAVPDEALLPTLLLNGAAHLNVVNDRRRYIRWTTGRPHPEVLTLGDLPGISASHDFFLRKVDSIASAELLDQLDLLADAKAADVEG